MVYIDSCFLMISDTDDFFQLEVNLLEDILSRSSLFVTNESEVYQAVDQWINYNFIEREKFSKRLLHKIRLPLLTEKTLKTILTKNSCFKKNKDSLAVVNDILKGNFDFYSNKPSKFLTARFCGHYSFEIMYFGVEKITKVAGEIIDDEVLRITNSDDYKNPEMLSSLARKRYGSKAVYLKGNVYIFGGLVKEVELYSHLAKTCRVIANIKDINDFDIYSYAVCSFIDKIYLIGGFDDDQFYLNSCIEFDTKDFSWKHKSKMIDIRKNPAACVFEEKIIVSGGLQRAYDDFDDFANFINYYDNFYQQTLNTVEAYDPIVDTWTEFPTMNYSRCRHKSVVVKNKLFVIAGGIDTNEVYDSTSKKFTVLKSFLNLHNMHSYSPFAAFSIRQKLFTYFEGSSSIFCFDTTKDVWCEELSKPTDHIDCFSAVTAPRLLSEM